MTPGPRHHKQASLRIAVCEALPAHMQPRTREIVSLRCTNPRKGYATALMLSVCREADRAGMVLLVQPGAFDEGMTTEQLARWYGRLGFQELPKDEGQPTMMARPPTPNDSAHLLTTHN